MKKLLHQLFTLLVLLPAAQAEVTYFIPDASGSPIAAMNEAGTIIWRKHYTPFGAELEPQTDSNRISYTGHVKDDATGLIYMGGRYYDPTVPRFMSMDPAAINPNDPRTFNRYNYANNNPLRYVDPDGRESQEALYKMLGIPDPNAGLVARAKAVAASANTAANVTDAIVSDPTNLVPGAAGAKLLGVSVLAVKGAKGAGNAANNAADGLRLNKSLASQSQMSEAGTIMAGAGGRVPFRDAQRVAEQYGGNSPDWIKKTSSSYTARDGVQFETHWVENISTGQRVEFKTKFLGGE